MPWNNYWIAEQGKEIPLPHDVGRDYLWTSEGIMLRAKRRGLEGMVPVTMGYTAGLETIDPYAKMTWPKVPQGFVRAILDLAIQEGRKEREILFRLSWEESDWRLTVPKQKQGKLFCVAEEMSNENTLMEIHSHHKMAADFSGQDDRSDNGFRLYGVIGGLPEKPEIRMRLGIFGNFLEIYPTDFLELPNGIKEALCVDPEEAVP